MTFRVLATVLLLVLLLGAGMVLAPSAAAQGGDPGLSGTLVVQTVSGGPIYAVDADGSHLRYLTTGIDPALSPDGQWVAFTRWDGSQHGALGSLWVIKVDGTGERMVLGDVHQPKSPVWSPDGRHIALSLQAGGRLSPEYKCSHKLPTGPLIADDDGDYVRVAVEVEDDGDVNTRFCFTLLPHPFWGLRLVDVASGAFTDLPHQRFSYTPTWDPAHPWHLVYKGDQGLVNLDINQGTTWPLTDDPRDHAPVFSPDGRHIALSYWQHDHWDIHILNADGGGRLRLTQTPLSVIVAQRINGQSSHAWNNVAPTWSPDGSHIAFLTDRTGQWQIWVMPAGPAAAGQPRPLLPPGALEELYPAGAFQYHGMGERVLSWR